MNHVLTNLEAHLDAPLKTALREAVAPELANQLRRVHAQPRSIKKLKIQSALAVVERIEDPETLAAIQRCDRRIGVHRAISNHPRVAQVKRLQASQDLLDQLENEDTPGLVAPELAEHMSDELAGALRGLSAYELLSWLEAARPQVAAQAVRRLYDAYPADPGASPEGHPEPREILRDMPPAQIVLAAAAGRLRLDETLVTALVSAIKSGPSHRAVQPGHVAAYRVLDVPLAKALVRVEALCLWKAFDRVEPEAIDVLATSRRHLLDLIEQGLVSDDQILDATEDWPGELKARAILMSTSLRVRDELIQSLPAQSASGLTRLLRTTPDLSSASRMTLLRQAEMYDIAAFARGQFSSRPRPGELTKLVDHLLVDRSDRWAVTLVRHLSGTSRDDIVHDGFFELVEAALDKVPASAFHAVLRLGPIAEDSLLLEALAGRFSNRLTSQEQWSTMLRLMPEWEHPLGSLLDSAVALA